MDEATEFEGADKVYENIDRLIFEQLGKALEECRKSGTPVLNECCIPADLRNSTYRLPSMDDDFNDFFDLDNDSEWHLAKQLDWTPPGWTSPNMKQLRAIPNHGNYDCVFHAVSVALWGVSDRKQILRELTSIVLEGHHGQLKNDFARGKQKMAARWFSPQPGKEQVNSEWEYLCQFIKTAGIAPDWFVLHILSNILRRPVVMHGLELSDGGHKQEMRGIFLPSMIDPADCYKTPIVVGYAHSGESDEAPHLTSLVGYDGELSYVSLVDDNGKRLPVWYGVGDKKEGHPCPETVLLEKYLELVWHEAPDGKKYPLATLGVMKMNVGNDAVMLTANRIRSLFEKEKEEGKMAEKITEGAAEQADSGVGADDVRPEEATRKRQFDGPDEVELSRPSKRTLPSSPSMSLDAAIDHGADSALFIAPASPLAATYVEIAEQAGSGVCDHDVRPEEAKRKREVDGPDEVELSRLSKRTLPSSLSISFDTPVDHALSIAPASPLAVHVLPMPSPSARTTPMQRPFAGEQGTPDAWPPRGRGRLATACLAAAAAAGGVATTILIVRAKWQSADGGDVFLPAELGR